MRTHGSHTGFGLVLALGIPSCGQASTSRGDSSIEQGSGADHPEAGTSAEAGSNNDGSDTRGPALAGEVRDESGTLLADLPVLACQLRVCFFGKSGADGRFVIPVEPPAEVALKTLENPDVTPRRGAALIPVFVSGEAVIDVGTLWVPLLPQGALVGPANQDPQTLSVGDGLDLTVKRTELQPPLGITLTHVTARVIAPERVPRYPALKGEEVLAVYAFHPFGTVSRLPIPVRIPLSLAAGTSVKFRTISEINGRFSTPVPGTADGAFIATDPTSGIENLTWLVVSR